MKLYILKPSDKWEWCGGGAVVLATTLANAQNKLQEREEYEKVSVYESEEMIPDNHECYASNSEGGCDLSRRITVEGCSSNSWVLVESFEMPNEKKERVVFFDYHEG